MSKQQSIVEPSEFQTFGELLRYLRERAKLTQRGLAQQVGYHYSYLSRLEKNERAPDETVLRARFIPALKLQNESLWVKRITELARETRPAEQPPAVPVPDPLPETAFARLPVPFTSFLGRAREVETLERMLRQPDVRLVTLVGPPGVGKTRLALHAAERLAADFEAGAVFVNLMPVLEADQVIPAFALALDVRETARLSVLESVSAALKSKNLLIVADNFEQVAEAGPQLLALLGEAKNVKILVTSREALRLRGEKEFPLVPLPVPGETETNLQDFPSVQLFLQRARDVKPDFPQDDETASRAAEICRRLDGLPLAIELAAARVGALSLSAMLKQLHRRFDWLTYGKRDLPAWRQNLWDAVEWSYSLLDVQERVLMNRLSVFSDGWTLEAAEAICCDDTICLASDVLNLLMRLADKSMIAADTEQDRFHFLESLREFAHKKLNEENAFELMRQRHAQYFMNFMQVASPNIKQGNDVARWLDRVEADHNNLRAVMTWIVEDPSRIPSASEFIVDMGRFWYDRNHFTEGRRWLDQIVAAYSEPTAERANLLRTCGDFHRVQGDYAEARLIEEEGLAVSKALGYERGMYQSMDALAILAGIQRDYARASELLEQVLDYRRRTKDALRLTATLNNLAIASRRLGNFERARELYEEAISVTRENGNLMSLGHALNGLSEVHTESKDFAAALELQRQGLEVRRQIGDWKGVAFSLGSIAISLHHLDKPARAAQLESACIKLRGELGVSFPAIAQAEHDELSASLRAKLGEAAFDEAWARGQSLSRGQAVALATE